MSMPSDVVQLPPGVTISASREASQANSTGQIVQGMVFTLTLPNGTPTSVFIPYNILGSTAAVSAAFNQRVAQIQAIQNLQAS